jgi:hypothetical protein
MYFTPCPQHNRQHCTFFSLSSVCYHELRAWSILAVVLLVGICWGLLEMTTEGQAGPGQADTALVFQCLPWSFRSQAFAAPVLHA